MWPCGVKMLECVLPRLHENQLEALEKWMLLHSEHTCGPNGVSIREVLCENPSKWATSMD